MNRSRLIAIGASLVLGTLWTSSSTTAQEGVPDFELTQVAPEIYTFRYAPDPIPRWFRGIAEQAV